MHKNYKMNFNVLGSTAIALAIAIFLSEDFLPRPARQFIRFVVELLAAIPSVVYGLWGIFVVIPIISLMRTTVLISPSVNLMNVSFLV